MKIIKPLRLMVMPRPYRWRNGKYLAVAVAALIKDDAGKVSIQPEHTLVHDIFPELDSDEVLDFVMPKPNPEFLVSGNAYTAHQDDKTHCMVTVQVGDKRKDGLVFGDRFWLDGQMSGPAPFEAMPLTWGNSFGGTGHPGNPLGTGCDEVVVNGVKTVRLPNLENPVERIHSKGQQVRPWNFGQIRIDWPHRLDKMGTYTEEWLKNVGTGFFDDMQAEAFNAAADDQIWKDRQALAMDEPFEIWNMHPEKHSWSGTLPPLQARCFINRRGNGKSLDEVPMRPTTVWFVPHRQSYVLIFHGRIPIHEDDAFDVAAIMAGIEYKHAPRAIGHYDEIFGTRSDPDSAALHALRDHELMPADILAPWIEEIDLSKNAMLGKLANRLARESAAYPHGEFVGPVKPLNLADLPALIEQGDRMRDEALEEQARDHQKMLDELRDGAKSAKSSEERQLMSAVAESIDFVGGNRKPKLPHRGPPDTGPMLKSVTTLEGRRATRRALAQAESGPHDMREVYEFNKRALRKMYLYSVHYQDGVARVGPHRAIELRERVQKKHRLNKNLKEMDLTGADLSGMDLAGADFSESWLEKADFSNTNLAGAIFNETVLARASFAGANLDGARLYRANISEAEFERTSLKGAQLEAVLLKTRTVFHACHFADGSLENFTADEAEFQECSLQRMQLHGISFGSAVLRDCSIEDSDLDKLNFHETLLENLDITGTAIGNSVFMESVLKSVRIVNSTIARTVFTEEVAVQESAFEATRISQSMFREIDFSGTSFVNSVFEQCDFSLANMQKCNLQGIKAPQSMFVRVNFDFATLAGSDLMQGNFQKASFVGADLRGCNFFRADMSETTLDASTQTSGAYVRRTRLAPFRDNVPSLGGRP